MSSKDVSVYSKEALMSTAAGKEILKQALMHSRGYKQFDKYKEKTEREFTAFAKRFTLSLHKEITSDANPSETLAGFAKEVGSPELLLHGDILQVKSRLSDPSVLGDRVGRILNSNFVKMTFPVFNALFDAASEYFGRDGDEVRIPSEKREAIIDGHIIAIDLSEPMDRIVDKDEDVEFLDDYRLMNPYILKIARHNISQGGKAVVGAFERGFADARAGQYIDLKLKADPPSISDENMAECYKKYRAVMGTAGRNMALNRRPLGDIFHLGMAKAGESVGCGNEIEDAIKNRSVKVPSWPLYFAANTGDLRKAFDLTLKRGEAYLDEARLAVDMLPSDFELRDFLEFLFLTVSHYNQYWYGELKRQQHLFDEFQAKLDAINIW
jgi:hypothetical protein